MRAVIAIILAFAITANCGLLKRPQEANSMLSLVQIDQHPLGKSLLSLASLHMKAQGPLQELPILLQQIHDDLDTQYTQNEQKHESDVAYCTETIAHLKQVIYDNGKLYSLNRKINIDAKASLARLQTHLSEVESATAANEKRTTEGTAQREQQHALYEADLADNKDAIEACGQAVQLLNALRSGTSFVQLKNKFQQVSDKLESTKTAKHAHIYTPIIKALAQITSKADQEVIKRILDLLNNLLTQLHESHAKIEETEATQSALWAKELEDLTIEHARLVADKAQTESDIEDREDTIAASQEAMDSHLKTATNAGQNLIYTQKDCEAREQNYQNIRHELEREIEIVQALQDHFESKLAGLQEYIDNAPAAF